MLSLFSSSVVFAKLSTDPLLLEQWYLEKIQAFEAWDSQTGSDEIIVAVLDTGLDLDHPDLKDNIWVNTEEIPGDGIDNDKNGFIDDVNGYDFVDGDASPVPQIEGAGVSVDAVAHGTLIAGIIGAVANNNEGITGINWNVKLMSVRMLDKEGIGESNHAKEAVEYAIANGAKVINLSFTGYDHDPSFEQVVKKAYEAGVVVVAAVGNEEGGVDLDEKPIYPACYGGERGKDWVIGVASTDFQDVRSSFSNYGSGCVDIAAPGEDIFGTVFQQDGSQNFSKAFYESGWGGTSMASPMVAGAAALLLGAYPSLTPAEVKIVLQLSVDPVTSSGDSKGKLGAGRLNVNKALSIASSFASEPEQNEPKAVPTSKAITKSSQYHIVVAPESGGPPLVRVLKNSGEEVSSFMAFSDSFSGGVRIAIGDIDGDGTEEIIAVPASGGPQVRIFSLDGTLRNQFFAYDTEMTSGLYVATGDVNGDGTEEILTSTDGGGTGEVNVFTWQGTKISSFTPDANASASIRVASGDTDGDGSDEVLLSYGPGMEPRIDVFSFSGEQKSTFLAYAQGYTKGVFVASGDLDGDGDDEIVTGTDKGGGPQVQIFDGVGGWLGTFFAYGEDFRGGVRLSVGNLSDSPGASIITSAGPGGGPQVRVFTGRAKLIGTFFTEDTGSRAGINAAAWSM